jgi:hypothetical protein
MRSFLKDWRRWGLAERVVASTFMASSLIGIPLAIAMNIH